MKYVLITTTLFLFMSMILLSSACQSAQPFSSQSMQSTGTTAKVAVDNLPPLSDVPEMNAVGETCLLDMGNQRVLSLQKDKTAMFYLYDEKTNQSKLLFSAMGRALGVQRIGETAFLIHWYTASHGNEYRRYEFHEEWEEQDSGIDQDVVRFCYVGDDLYYTKQNDNAEALPYRYSLYVIGTNEQPILKNVLRSFFVENGYIYYSRENTVYAVNRTGEQSVKICDFPVYNGHPAVQFYRMGQWLVADYGVDAAHTYAYHTTTGQKVELDVELYAGTFAADATYFYVGGAQGVYQIDKQTFAYKQLCPFSGMGICLYDGYLYFSETDAPNCLYQLELSTALWHKADDFTAILE